MLKAWDISNTAFVLDILLNIPSDSFTNIQLDLKVSLYISETILVDIHKISSTYEVFLQYKQTAKTKTL